MTVAQFLLPGESMLYEAPDEVYYRRTPFALYVTGERLLLYAVTGRPSPLERALMSLFPMTGSLAQRGTRPHLKKVASRALNDSRMPRTAILMTVRASRMGRLLI